MKIAVVIIAFNRVDSLKRLINSLQNAYYSETQAIDLIVSVDYSDCKEVYSYVDSIRWGFGDLYREYKEINMGLREHIMSCGNYFSKYHEDALIILEDDLFVCQNYAFYAKKCVEKYCTERNIGGISLYAMGRSLHTDLPFIPLKGRADVYFMKYAQSWGQIWMKDQWQQFKEWYDTHQNYDFTNAPIPQNVRLWPKSSWLKYHIAYCIENNKYFVYPYESLTTNFAEAGVHYKNKTDKMQVKLLYGKKTDYILPNLNEEEAIKYDGFEEIEILGKYLGIDGADICVDLYGLKSNFNKKKYILTSKIYNYKIVKSYDLTLIPHERNIIEGIDGNMIFLYDTSVSKKNIYKNDIHRQGRIWDYYFSTPNLTKFKIIGIYFNHISELVKLVLKAKIKRMFREKK